MKNTLLGLCIAATLPCSLQAFDEAQEISKANQASAEFAAALKTELVAAMQSGGPLAAIETCNTKAPSIASKVSQQSGLSLSRVSMKNRNPGNAAGEWQTAVLLDFEKRKESGESLKTLTWHESVETRQGKEFRFMKAIPTGGLCLQCHGTAISPEVEDRLKELYPDDKASGYSEGDIRGAFVVISRPD
jgi:hypothetical protein